MKFSVDLVTSSVFCNELSVKQYKDILKSTWPEHPLESSTLETLFTIFSELTNKQIADFYDLNLFEIFLLLLEIRIQSFGNICNLSVVDNTNKSVNLSLNLITVRETTKDIYKQFLNDYFINKNLKIKIGIPNVSRLMQETVDEHLLFVQEITLVSEDKKIKIDNNKTAEMLIDNMEFKISNQLISHYECLVKSIQEINFLSPYPLLSNQKLPFNITIECLIWYVKLLFAEPLDVFYDNMFYLSHLGKMNLAYLETCTPGEYVYFTKKLEYVISANQSPGENQTYEDDLLNEELQ